MAGVDDASIASASGAVVSGGNFPSGEYACEFEYGDTSGTPVFGLSCTGG